jgi:hypothetical protein
MRLAALALLFTLTVGVRGASAQEQPGTTVPGVTVKRFCDASTCST